MRAPVLAEVSAFLQNPHSAGYSVRPVWDWGGGWECRLRRTPEAISLVAAGPARCLPSLGLLTTNQCLEYISQRHQLLKHVSISGFWAFLPFQSSQWLEPAWLMCPRLAEPSDFTVLHMLDNNCPSCLSLTWH